MTIRTATSEEMPQWRKSRDAAKRRIAELAASLSVGDVLHKVLMWENTANFFYEVVSIDDSDISFRRLNVDKHCEEWGYGEETPTPGSFFDDKIITKDKRDLGEFRKWDGKPAYYTYLN